MEYYDKRAYRNHIDCYNIVIKVFVGIAAKLLRFHCKKYGLLLKRKWSVTNDFPNSNGTGSPLSDLYLFQVNQNASSAMVCRVVSHKSYELYHHVYRTLRQRVAMALSRHHLGHVLIYRSKRRENKALYSNHTNSLPPSLFDVARLHQVTNDIWDFDLQSNQAMRPTV